MEIVKDVRFRLKFSERKKERNKKKARVFKYPCWQAFDTRNTARQGGEEEGKVKRKRINDDVSDVAHERPFIRPQRDIYWGKRVRGKEERPDEDYVICIW